MYPDIKTVHPTYETSDYFKFVFPKLCLKKMLISSHEHVGKVRLLWREGRDCIVATVTLSSSNLSSRPWFHGVENGSSKDSAVSK